MKSDSRIKEAIELSRDLRRQSTNIERLLWEQLRDRRFFGLKVRRQHRIGPYTADFCCVEKSVVIELDGGQHLESVSDGVRDAYLQKLGFRVLRYWDNIPLDSILEALYNELIAPHPHPLPASRGEGAS